MQKIIYWLKKFRKNLDIVDIPKGEEADINTGFISWYIIFTKKVNINATDALEGLKEIFLR